MMPWILAVLLLGDPAPIAQSQSAAESQSVVQLESDDSVVARSIAAQSQTGTLLVSRGDCLAIRVYTRSPYTHVAAIVMTKDQPVVYDSINGVGVRRLALNEYLAMQQATELCLFQPSAAFTKAQADAFEAHLASQLGRPYRVRQHLSGKRLDGVHCSEYVTDALMACGLVHAEQPARVSPASLVTGITEIKLYHEGLTFLMPTAVSPPLPADATWCRRMWSDTKHCSSDCYGQMQRWFCCK